MSAPRTFPQALNTDRYFHTHTYTDTIDFKQETWIKKPKKDGITQTFPGTKGDLQGLKTYH